MGRRSRRRESAPAPSASRPTPTPSPSRAAPAPTPSRRASGASPARPAPAAADRPSPASAAPGRPRTDRPPAPWDPFPLTELCVLLGLILLVWGLLRRDDAAGRVLLVCGMVLGSLGGLETALREHFGGGRSHGTLLAALPAVLVAGVLFFARVPWVVVPVAAGLVFAAAFAALRRSRRRIAPPSRLG